MAPLFKFSIGLAGALTVGWLYHGPLGAGETLISGLEAQAQAVVARAEVPGVAVRMERDPLARRAILSGPADRFQREGQGEFPGLDERVGGIEGIASIRWTNPPPR